MKFTNGYWLIKENVEAAYAAEAYDVEETCDETGRPALVVYAPTRRVNHRGDTLNGTLLKIQYSSPMEDVVRVRITHFEGVVDRGPHYELFPSTEETETGKQKTTVLPSSSVQLRVNGTTPATRLLAQNGGGATPLQNTLIPPE
ncbi:MAG: hypothetical protein N2Z76_06170, partial [Treponemataceae bacterium]|nr:hypothetical protein [Treponemataceae bacterium]